MELVFVIQHGLISISISIAGTSLYSKVRVGQESEGNIIQHPWTVDTEVYVPLKAVGRPRKLLPSHL